MKWFLKVLRHYADFSGRARRKEYWMFALFNIIFMPVWLFLFTAVFAFVNSDLPDFRIVAAAYNACSSYGIVMLLPGLALAVRRMHDLGKSGWTLLVGLIPFIGGIWLFVLMLIDGEPGENRFGPNPKTSPETFSDRAKLKSAGVALIVAFIIVLLGSIFNLIVSVIVWNNPLTDYFLIILHFISTILLLIAGSYLLKEKTNSEIQEKKVVTLLLVSVSITIVFGILNLISLYKNVQDIVQFWGWNPIIGPIISNMISVISCLSIALFATSILFSPKNKDLIRNTAVLAIIFLSLFLLWEVYYSMHRATQDFPQLSQRLQNMFGTLNILVRVAYIVLVGTFLSIKREKKIVM